MTLSRHSGDEVYRHAVYGKQVFTVPPKNGGLERAPECRLGYEAAPWYAQSCHNTLADAPDGDQPLYDASTK